MILLASFLLLLKESVEAQAAGSNVIQYEKCGSNYNQAQIEQCQVSNFLLLKSNKIKDKAKAMGESWSTPNCDEDSTCQVSVSDPCSFYCIKKVDCPNVVEYCIDGPNGKQCYCDCTLEVPQFGSYWSCDNTGRGNKTSLIILYLSYKIINSN